MSGLAYLDVPMIFFGICSMIFTLRFLDKPNWKNIVISGFFIGLLIGTKWIQPILYIIPMVLLILLQFRKKIHLYFTTLMVGFSVLIVSWLPLIWNFGINGIIDFFYWINSYWAPQFSMSRENSLLKVALWNMSIPELILFSFCFLILFVTAIIDIKDKRVSYLNCLPVITAFVFLIALQIETRGAVYYWTIITPIVCIILAEGLTLLKDHIVVSYNPPNKWES
jgi:4-amino-4-deoxy-L-arabinose transferase-like glycosyltransferase